VTEFFKKAKDFITKYAGFFCILVLILFCYLFLYLNLGAYRLIDVDETRYVNIARGMFANGDFITPYLNFEPFLEKPPLFFWLIVLSYKILGSTGEFASRLPGAVLCTLMVFGTYFFGKKAIGSKIFGLVSALILLSSIWTGLFSRLAIMDIGFTALTAGCIYCAVITLFNVEEKNKKYFWYLSYLFMGLSVLQKGLIGIIIPALVIVLTFLALKKGKEIVKPVNIIPGVIIALLVALPWHILAYKANGGVFIDNYIIKHHFARFLNSATGFNRKQPFLFYIPVLLIGFIPWIFTFISALVRGIKSMIKDFRATKSFRQIFSGDTNDRKLLIFASIYMLTVLIFFSISSTKLPTYILPAFPALALITGYYWWGYITDDKFQKGIKIASITGAIILIIIGLGGALFLNLPFLSPKVLSFAQSADSFRMLMSSWVIVLSLITLLCLISKNRSLLFVANVILMVGVSIITSAKVLSFTTTFGQNELENYANKASAVSGSKLITYGFSKKYCLLNNYEGKVYYLTVIDNEAYSAIKTIIQDANKENVPVYLITKIKRQYPEELMKNFKLLEKGKKYDLYVK